MFGRATIRLGIGPHSSFDFVFSVLVTPPCKVLATEALVLLACSTRALQQSAVMPVTDRQLWSV